MKLDVTKNSQVGGSFFIDEFNTNIIYQNDSVCVIEGSFILHMEEYQATTQYFYSIVLKNNQIELLHTSIGNNISHEKEESFYVCACILYVCSV